MRFSRPRFSRKVFNQRVTNSPRLANRIFSCFGKDTVKSSRFLNSLPSLGIIFWIIQVPERLTPGFFPRPGSEGPLLRRCHAAAQPEHQNEAHYPKNQTPTRSLSKNLQLLIRSAPCESNHFIYLTQQQVSESFCSL